ncbi:MAG TPA: TIGR03621 family F420-dependent LLM class oxidoreductase [Ilumatobacteraceae bacterium]|nr:TIGR03621 family F420-dependent LLM class oxidoreductase [Ilumatobacteraceae bacterium]
MAPRTFRFAMQARPLDDHDGLVAAARLIESLGYEELYSYDHIGAVDPFIPLIVAAEATTRLCVGPLVLNNELHHPALLARTAATVDRLTGGRLVLGIGTGYAQDEHDAVGIPLRDPRARVDRFEESIVALRMLLDKGAAQLDGAHHQLHLDDLGIRPLQTRVPLLIGGHGRRVVAIAARHADIFQFTGLTHAEDGRLSAGGFAIEAVRERARWLADCAGDRLGGIERSALVQHVEVLGDLAADSTDFDTHLAELAERFQVSAEVLAGTPFVLVGSPQQIVDKLERLRADVGITHYVVRDAEAFAPVVAALAGR